METYRQISGLYTKLFELDVTKKMTRALAPVLGPSPETYIHKKLFKLDVAKKITRALASAAQAAYVLRPTPKRMTRCEILLFCLSLFLLLYTVLFCSVYHLTRSLKHQRITLQRGVAGRNLKRTRSTGFVFKLQSSWLVANGWKLHLSMRCDPLFGLAWKCSTHYFAFESSGS